MNNTSLPRYWQVAVNGNKMTKSKNEWQKYMGNCKFYTGIFNNKTCKVDVDYETVRDDSHPDSYRWPCFTGNGTKTKCALAEFPTEAEAKEEEARRGKMLADFFAKIAKAICPHCDTPIKRERQVGRCAYAEPCGCRLWQGKARSAEELEKARNTNYKNGEKQDVECKR